MSAAVSRAYPPPGDPETAARLVRNDYYRAERALEIVRSSGRPMADFKPGVDGEGGGSLFDFRCFHLAVPRLQLYRRIDARCETMLADGILDEAAALWQSGCRPGDDGRDAPPAGRSIGYAQSLELLRAALAARAVGEAGARRAELRRSLEGCLEEMQRASRNYAKRQATWFRGEPAYRWVDTRGGREVALESILAAFRAAEHVPCVAAEEAAEEEDSREAGAGALLQAAAAGDKRAAEKAAKARARALNAYVSRPSGALTAQRRDALVDWLERWAAAQPKTEVEAEAGLASKVPRVM